MKRAAVVWACALMAAVLLAGCDWSTYRFGANHSGFNPTETDIAPGRLALLQLATTFEAPFPNTLNTSVAVANGKVFASGVEGQTAFPSHFLYAFAEKSGANCSGVPRHCAPLWGALLGTDPLDDLVRGTPSVANAVVYVVTGTTLFAFRAAGGSHCVGSSPPMCPPLWTAAVGSDGSVTVAGGVVYVGGYDGISAFDAAGTQGCAGPPSARVCSPLWTAPTNFVSGSSPAVADGVVYIGSEESGTLYAFDAHGTTRCTGVTKTCAPLWTASLNGSTASSPAVVNGVVYIGGSDNFVGSGEGRLYAFDADGTQGCSGPPTARVCNPLWTANPGGEITGSPAVAQGRVYVGSSDGILAVFDAAGQQSCSGSPKTCAPLMTADTNDTGGSSPAIAGNVVFIQSNEIGKVSAFDATGNLGCTGTPKQCTPLWSVDIPFFGAISPVVANGVVYIGNGDDVLGYAIPPTQS